jgi:hypothetical protein
VITNCTSRKRGGAHPVTLNEEQHPADLGEVSAAWQKALATTPPVHVVRDLYAGRTFADAYRAARVVEGELFVASAGLGLVHEADQAPAYDMTFADRTNPLARIGARVQFTPADWWGTLGRSGVGRGLISDLVRATKPSLTLLAMPAGYLAMIARDLDALQPEELESLRIFTSTSGAEALPRKLRMCAMPYDERLESIEGYSGTRTDFAQRALLHFVERLSGHQQCASEAKILVQSTLAGLAPRIIPTRKRLTDAEIAMLLRNQWQAHKGSSVQLLRYLRRDAQVACEQKRFQGIWTSLRQEFAKYGGRAT